MYGDSLLLNRVDGILINVTDNSSQPIEINNGSVLLDRQVRFTFEEEENSVVLISLEYESGKYSRESFPNFRLAFKNALMRMESRMSCCNRWNLKPWKILFNLIV